MKKLFIALLTLTLALGACTSDAADADLGATITDLANEAQTLLNESDLDAQVANAVEVVANNATTVGLAQPAVRSRTRTSIRSADHSTNSKHGSTRRGTPSTPRSKPGSTASRRISAPLWSS